MPPLTRDNFRMQVFERDSETCVVPECGREAVDAHHIIDRSLWSDEGYYADNGASLCERCHILAEKDIITPDSLRFWAGIINKILPSGTEDVPQTKWGTPLEPSSERTKYPSTPFLDISPYQDGDQIFSNYQLWEQCRVVITAKMDGACVKLTRDGVAARNGEHANSEMFDWLKGMWSSFCVHIPEGISIFGEWLAYQHTIAYEGDLALKSPLLVYAAFDGLHWVGWDQVKSLADRIGHATVPVLGHAESEQAWRVKKEIQQWAEKAVSMGHEGIVARPVHPFFWGQFATRVAKYVHQGFEPAKYLKQQVKNQIRG